MKNVAILALLAAMTAFGAVACGGSAPPPAASPDPAASAPAPAAADPAAPAASAAAK